MQGYFHAVCGLDQRVHESLIKIAMLSEGPKNHTCEAERFGVFDVSLHLILHCWRPNETARLRADHGVHIDA